MKLKKIETGMVIRCTEEQTEILQEKGIVDKDCCPSVSTCWVINCIPTDTFEFSIDYIRNNYPEYKIVDFADLVETELTAEELLDWIRDNYYCEEPMTEAFGEDICIDDLLDKFTSNEVIERIAKHIKDHEKKEPEVEWVDVCCILKALDNHKIIVHEEDIIFAESDGNIWGSCERILKNWCKEHDGEYVAKIDCVCRVKV